MFKKRLLSALILVFLLTGCGSTWQSEVIAPDGSAWSVDRRIMDDLADFETELAGEGALPLERVLWAAGHRAIDQLVVTDPDGKQHTFDWPAVAAEAWWLKDGSLQIGGERLDASRLEAVPPPLLGQVSASITDLAPTAANMLGLPAPAQAEGHALEAPQANLVVLFFLDGLGYVRYSEALEADLIPNLAALGQPLVGLTVYPPVTSVASAALLTGAPPEVNGVVQRGIRTTDLETLFDVAHESGLAVVAIEGDALAFNLRNAEINLSGDRDGDGSTDDNVLANALAMLDQGMPDLLYVHFHGIDDAGHDYGPGAPEEAAAISQVDAGVGHILEALPENTAVILFADHGMHLEGKGEEEQGNHGHLIERDMFIPIILTETE
jgi:hypothetical protein